MFLEFTNTKIINNHVTSNPHPLYGLDSSKSLKFRNYGEAPCIFSSYCKFPQVNFFTRLFT